MYMGGVGERTRRHVAASKAIQINVRNSSTFAIKLATEIFSFSRRRVKVDSQ